jgi:P27 family predicted phage terminase small subunit
MAGPALECWERVSHLLFSRGQLTQDSEVSLIALCQVYAEWTELREDIAKNGRFHTTKSEKTGEMERLRPAVRIFSDCDKRLRAWLIEFGLTDASRAKVSAFKPPQGDAGTDPLGRYGLN